MAHDYRDDKSSSGAVLVVRTGNRYGAAGPGEEVIVDVKELRNPATLSACMPLDDYERYVADLEAKRAAAPAPAASLLKAAVEAELARITAAAVAPKESDEIKAQLTISIARNEELADELSAALARIEDLEAQLTDPAAPPKTDAPPPAPEMSPPAGLAKKKQK